MIRRADTMGVFQIESRAQMSMLPRLKPRSFYDLVIEVAIVRPGPIQGDMVHPYLRRRNGEEPVTYPSEAIRGVLQKTLGVPLFQEQAMRLAVAAAGFTPGEADQLRRAMGAWRRPGVIDQFRKRLIEGMRANGLAPEYAEAVFRQIRGFGEYGFPESHAASFALLVYVSAWLKCHYQAAFTAALLNSQPMGFYAPAQLVRNAREHGVEVRPADVNFSRWDCTLEDEECKMNNEKCKMQDEESSLPSPFSPLPSPSLALRLGFRMVSGFSEAHARRIEEAQAAGPFRSLDDFARRTGLTRAVIVRLAKAGAFGSLGLDRRGALWHALAQEARQERLPLFEEKEEWKMRNEPCKIEIEEEPEPKPPRHDIPLPRMSPAQEVLADYRTTGLSLRAHPMRFLRKGLEGMGVVPAQRLATWPNGKPVRVAGVVLVRQRPGTAKGITFVTLEDETGTANLIIRPDVWKKFRTAALGATVLLAHGRLQREGLVIHVLVTRLENLSGRMQELTSQSRDFC
jgi:error-prone DNA polymerase